MTDETLSERFARVRSEIDSEFSANEEFAFDLETTGLSPHADSIRGAALAAGDRGWYLPVLGSNAYPFDEVMLFIKGLLSAREKTVVMHNGKFDFQFLYKQGIDVLCKFVDTWVAAYLCDETRAGKSRLRLKGKGGLIYELYGITLPEYRDTALAGAALPGMEDVIKDEATYAADDAYWTLKVWQEKLKPQLRRDKNLWRWFESVEMEVTRCLADMEYRGFKVDMDFLDESEEIIAAEMEALEKELVAMAPEPFNPGSPQQVARMFYGKMGFEPPPGTEKTKAGVFPVGKGLLAAVRDPETGKTPAIIDKYLAWKAREKMMGTYVRGLRKEALKHGTGRIHANFWQAGTATGRLCVSGDTVLKTSMGDFQIRDFPEALLGKASVMTHRGRLRPVVAKFIKGDEVMLRLTVDDGTLLECTRGHRILTPGGWRSAGELSVGSVVCSGVSSSTGCKESRIAGISDAGVQEVWSIEVEEDHSYMVGSLANLNSCRQPNLENIPRGSGFDWQYTYPVKKAFVAEEGYTIIVLDYSQLELRIMAHLCGDSAMKQVYIDEYNKVPGAIDIHESTRLALAERSGNPEFPRTIAKNCVAEGTSILTSEGFVPVERLVPSDAEGRVTLARPAHIQSYDEVRTVEEGYYGGEKECLRVETEFGLVVEQTADHEIPVVRDGSVVMVETGELRVGDLVLMKVGANVHGSSGRLRVPATVSATSYKDVLLPPVLTPALSRFLGYYTAEGSAYCRNGYHVNIGFGTEDADVVADCRRAAEECFGDRVKILDNDRVRLTSLHSKKVYEWLIAEGSGTSSADKAVPECVRSSPWDIKREFFQAYFEGDGSVSGGVVRACSKSERLIRQISEEMMNIGLPGVVLSETRGSYGLFWVWQCNDSDLFGSLVGFVSDRKKAACVSEKAHRRSVLFLDGFESEVARVAPLLKGRDRNKMTECLTHSVRLGETRLTPAVKSRLEGDARFLVDNGLWTVRVRKIEPCGVRRVYDLYEPVHKVMVAGSLVTGDCNFGLLYGQTPEGLQRFLWLSAREERTVEECIEWHAAFFEKYPGLKEYQDRIFKEVAEKGYVKNIAGIKRNLGYLFGLQKGSAYRIGLNFTDQSSAAVIIKIAMRNIRRRWLSEKEWKRYDPQFVDQVHDELVIECREEGALPIFKMAKFEMENALKLSVPLKAEGGWAKDWMTAKKTEVDLDALEAANNG